MGLYNEGHITSIPNAVNYLYDLYTATWQYDPNNIPVYYWVGVELGAYSAPATVEINDVGEVTREWAVLGPRYEIEEHYAITCKLTYFTGQGTEPSDYLTTMNTVFTGWGQLEIAVANDPTLGGSVRLCWFDECNYEPTTDGSGRACGTVTWLVRCEARVTTLSLTN